MSLFFLFISYYNIPNHMENISDSTLLEYKEAFGLFDRDGDGEIGASELGNVMRALGQTPTQTELNTIISDFDTSGSESIDFSEFMTLMTQQEKTGRLTEQDLIDAFVVFDSDRNGHISVNDIRHIMTCLGDKLTDSEFEEMMTEVDPDGDGMIDYEHFSNVIMRD